MNRNRIFSHEPTALAYDGSPSADNQLPENLAGHRVIIKPGVNELSDKDVDLLRNDPMFERNFRNGHHVHIDEEGRGVERQPVPEPHSDPKSPAVEASPEVTDFLALSQADQDALYETLAPEAKAAVDAKRAEGK